MFAPSERTFTLSDAKRMPRREVAQAQRLPRSGSEQVILAFVLRLYRGSTDFPACQLPDEDHVLRAAEAFFVTNRERWSDCVRCGRWRTTAKSIH